VKLRDLKVLVTGGAGFVGSHLVDELLKRDNRVIIEDLIAEGDKVVCRFTASGTHQGEFMGIPPTEKRVTIMEIRIYRIIGGKIVECWGLFDQMGLMQQLGVKQSMG
jgi:predicted ester cyclase